MRWLKLTLAYDGTAYAGWQIQPDQPTVQGTLQGAWREITGEQVRLTAAGRTDAGVHALGQVASVATESTIPNDELCRALNARLPYDMAVLAVDDARQSFHATYDAVSKTYRYRIDNGRIRSVFDRQYSWHYPRPLDAYQMQVAGQALVGRHDFASFETAGSERPDTIRTIFRLVVARGSDDQADFITLEVEGDGFLYNMVRAIVGTLVRVGCGARPGEWVADVLSARDRRRAGQTAPAEGLFLVHVNYG
jgi:tRNA pseudouridine38-40 synthase